MSILSACQWLQDTYIGTSIRESIWVFPIIETIHVLALSISVGLLLVSDLRLMGYIMKRRPVSEVYEQIKPWMFTGFAIMTITGIFLFWCQAVKAYNSIFFQDQGGSPHCRGHQRHRVRTRHLSQSGQMG